jgi:hypothetical protein
MDIQTRLTYLPDMHARLQWDDIIPAAAAVLSKVSEEESAKLSCEAVRLPLFDLKGTQGG